MEYTREQEMAVYLRDKDILVSAGAGAGKTRVLVNRMTEMIMHPNSPVPVDAFLVMTFTNAAAQEMKERITSELNDRLEKEPDNRYLRKQIRMMKQADISTVHSFCNRLLRTHFHELGLDPAFRIGEEGELFLLRHTAMEDLLEEAYESKRKSFLALVEAYAPGRSDQMIEDMIENLYRFSRGFPDMKGWFADILETAKKLNTQEGLENAPMAAGVLAKIKKAVGLAKEKVENGLTLFDGDGEPERFFCLLQQDAENLSHLMEAETYEEYYKVFSDISFGDLPRANKQEKAFPYLEEIKTIHKEVREEMLAWRENYFRLSKKQLCAENAKLYPYLEELFSLVQRFEELYFANKKDKNVYDFDDLEHLTLELLVDSYDEKGNPFPTETAKEIGAKYKAIFVDEYQDTNLVQETILRVLCQQKNDLFAVGDVKQSIYRFRQARPDLFLERYDKYEHVSEKNEIQNRELCIELRDNFRSSPNVLRFCNFVFETLMEKNFGGVDYGGDIALRAGANGPMEDCHDISETMLLVEDEEKESLNMDSMEAEIAMIARRIRELIDEGYEYRDIVILLRSSSGRAEPMADFLEARGIPASCESRTGYFHTREVSLILNYLAVVDNVYQDIPMASVMLSTIGKFTEEELACLKVLVAMPLRGQYTLYDLMQIYLLEGADDRLKEKTAHFLEQLHYFRQRKKEVPLHQMLWEIYKETGLYYDVLLLPDGEKRKENLLMLLKKAEDYEKTVFKGLFYFIRYMEQLKSYEIDLAEASLQENTENVVRIMTIHKSKGLEFPVVFVSGLSKNFNLMDVNQPVLFHPELGVGMEYVDIDARIHHPSLMKKLIREQMVKDTLEEELRILYVAMTRAQKKLILTGIIKEKMLEKEKNRKNATLSLEEKLSARSVMDWLIPVLGNHPDFKKYLKARYLCEGTGQAEKPAVLYDDTSAETTSLENFEKEEDFLSVKLVHFHELSQEFSEEKKEEKLLSLEEYMEKNGQSEMEAYIAPIKKAFEYEYPHKDATGWKRKYSVSELKKLSMKDIPGEESQIPDVSQESLLEEEIPAPDFLKEEKEDIAPTARGTIIHKIMELLNFGEIESKKDLFDALLKIEEVVPETKKISMKQVYAGLEAFLFSEIGEKLRRMDKEGKLYKELPFTVGLPAYMIDSRQTGEERVVVQGIIDACGEDEDGLWLFDYKTDRVTEGEESIFLDRYNKQMLYYKSALEQILGRKVVHSYIYSFSLKKYIEVNSLTNDNNLVNET